MITLFLFYLINDTVFPLRGCSTLTEIDTEMRDSSATRQQRTRVENGKKKLRVDEGMEKRESTINVACLYVVVVGLFELYWIVGEPKSCDALFVKTTNFFV